jgi:hypothetical protein
VMQALGRLSCVPVTMWSFIGVANSGLSTPDCRHVQSCACFLRTYAIAE